MSTTTAASILFVDVSLSAPSRHQQSWTWRAGHNIGWRPARRVRCGSSAERELWLQVGASLTGNATVSQTFTSLSVGVAERARWLQLIAIVRSLGGESIARLQPICYLMKWGHFKQSCGPPPSLLKVGHQKWSGLASLAQQARSMWMGNCAWKGLMALSWRWHMCSRILPRAISYGSRTLLLSSIQKLGLLEVTVEWMHWFGVISKAWFHVLWLG